MVEVSILRHDRQLRGKCGSSSSLELSKNKVRRTRGNGAMAGNTLVGENHSLPKSGDFIKNTKPILESIHGLQDSSCHLSPCSDDVPNIKLVPELEYLSGVFPRT